MSIYESLFTERGNWAYENRKSVFEKGVPAALWRIARVYYCCGLGGVRSAEEQTKVIKVFFLITCVCVCISRP